MNLEFAGVKLAELDRSEVLVVREASQLWSGLEVESAHVCDQIASCEGFCVGFDLVSEGVEANSLGSISDLLDKHGDLLSVLGNGEHEIVLNRGLLVGRQLGVVELTNLVDLAEFTNSTEEVIS